MEPTRSHQQFLKEINTVKENYNFKKPLIKQTILRKLVDCIQKVETRQFDFRKENVELMASMNRYEQSKRVEFDKFLDEKLEIDAVEVKCIAERFRSRA